MDIDSLRVLKLLLLLQLATIPASGLLIDAKICEGDHASHKDSSGRELLYINGLLVYRNVLCKAIMFCDANRCNVEKYLRNNLELPLKAGRKLLQKVVTQDHETIYIGSPSNAKMMFMATPAFFVLCCGLLCPCLRPKKKEAIEPVLAKEPSSMHSASSFEGNSASDKVPASPLRVPPSPSRFSMSPKLTRLGSIHLSMNDVIRATQNFSPSLQIGEGGFGTVYKAQLRDGQVVAIKRARKEMFEALRTEFSSEVDLLAKIDHRNLVKLLDYIDKGNERIIITEYVPNGTLRDHLDGQRGKILDFNQRLEISIDVAHALTYLHLYAEKQIIHRDVKSSNILLTESLRAKVADFGFARLGPADADKTHISTKVKGTVGYLDPEYMRTYQLTTKSDVYSFGILLIEILTGRRPVEVKKAADEKVTIKWAFKKYSEKSVAQMVDPLMAETVDTRIFLSMFGLALRCATAKRSDRPDMKAVGEQLWAIRMDYLRRARRP